jgi:hypothetical protein
VREAPHVAHSLARVCADTHLATPAASGHAVTTNSRRLMQKRAAGPAGRRARTKKVRDNTAVTGLVTDKEGLAAAVSAKTAGPSATVTNPFKSFLAVCDCSDAEESLLEVGIERVSDLLELNAELLAILELPEDLQHRLISAIQVATFTQQLKDLGRRNIHMATAARARATSMPQSAPQPPRPVQPPPQPMQPPSLVQPALATEEAAPPPRQLERQPSLALRPSLEGETTARSIQLHRQASAQLEEEINTLERKLSRLSSKNLLERASAVRPSSARASNSVDARAVLGEAVAAGAAHPAALSRTGSSSSHQKRLSQSAVITTDASATNANATNIAAAPAVGAQSKQARPATAGERCVPSSSAGSGGVSERIQALRSREDAETAAAQTVGEAAVATPVPSSTPPPSRSNQLDQRLAAFTRQASGSAVGVRAGSSRKLPSKAMPTLPTASSATDMNHHEENGPTARQRAERINALLLGNTSAQVPGPSRMAFPTRGGVKAAREALAAPLPVPVGPRSSPAATAATVRAGAGAGVTETGSREADASTVSTQREEAMKAIFGAENSRPTPDRPSAPKVGERTKNAALIARFEAKRAELAAAKQAAAPAEPPVQTQREMAMKAMFGGGQKRVSVPSSAAPAAHKNAKAAFFEEQAKLAKQAAAPAEPPVQTQREMAMKAMFGGGQNERLTRQTQPSDVRNSHAPTQWR